MFKALGRIGKDKTTFDVDFKPVEVRIYTNQAFNFKLQVERGKQDPVESKQIKVGRSVKNSDIKTAPFDESFTMPCTFFIKNGIPEEKKCMLQIIKLFPGGNEVVIAKAEVNFAMHFGEDFKRNTVEMEVTKQAQGSIVKAFTYEVTIKCTNPKD